MPLTVDRLEKMFFKHGYVIDSVFIYKDLCRYIRIISIKSGISIMIYVDPVFQFTIHSTNTKTISMKLIDFSLGETTVEKIRDYPDTNEVEQKYRQPISGMGGDPSESFDEKLESKYKYKIFLRDMDKPKMAIVKSCFRQLQRLSLMVQDLRYKMCMHDQAYLCVTEDEDIINCFKISTVSNKFVDVVIDLENFKKRISSIENDVLIIKQSMHTVISKNHDECLLNIKSLTKSLVDTFSSSLNFNEKVIQMDSDIATSIDLLQTLQKQLTTFLEQYTNLKSIKNEEIYVHEKNRLELKIKNSEETKQKILSFILSKREQKDSLFLMLDQAEFDSCIFLDTIKKRLQELDTLKS